MADVSSEAVPCRRRSTRLGPDQVRAIDHFAESLFVMFPHQVGVAHVGSSLSRDDYRDVDLRVVLDDASRRVLAAIIDLDDLHMLLSRWGQQVTGLPIDCQTQEQSEHRREMFGPNGAARYNWRGADRLATNARRLRATHPDASKIAGQQ